VAWAKPTIVGVSLEFCLWAHCTVWVFVEPCFFVRAFEYILVFVFVFVVIVACVWGWDIEYGGQSDENKIKCPCFVHVHL